MLAKPGCEQARARFVAVGELLGKAGHEPPGTAAACDKAETDAAVEISRADREARRPDGAADQQDRQRDGRVPPPVPGGDHRARRLRRIRGGLPGAAQAAHRRRSAPLPAAVQDVPEPEHDPGHRRLPVPAEQAGRADQGADRHDQLVACRRGLQPRPVHPAACRSNPRTRTSATSAQTCAPAPTTRCRPERATARPVLRAEVPAGEPDHRAVPRPGGADRGGPAMDAVRHGRAELVPFAASERYREDDTEYEHYADSAGKSGGQKEKLAYTILAASLAYQFKLEWGAAKSRTFRFAVIDEAFGRGSDESTRFALELFERLGLQLLIVTPAAEDPRHRAVRVRRRVRRQPDEQQRPGCRRSRSRSTTPGGRRTCSSAPLCRRLRLRLRPRPHRRELKWRRRPGPAPPTCGRRLARSGAPC